MRLLALLCPYKKYIPVVILCLMGISIITFLQPLLIRQITDKGVTDKDFRIIIIFSSLMLAFGIVNYLLQILQTSTFAKLHNYLQYDLKMQAFTKMTHIRIFYFKSRNEAKVVSTLTSDISSVASIADSISAFSVTSILQICGGLVGLFMLNWEMTLLIIVCIPIKYVVITILSKK